MQYYFPFGQELHPLVQEDKTPKKVFVLGCDLCDNRGAGPGS